MNILTQALENAYKESKEKYPTEEIEAYLSSIIWNPSAYGYGKLIENMEQIVKHFARTYLKNILEELDLEFKNKKDRTKKYYIKHTRKRTIITIFGEVTYKRTEYINRQNGEPFCYVDRKIGLESKMRYDPTICSLVYELYADHNSMIKVGKTIGDRIYGYSLKESRIKEWIPRQTVWRMLNRFKEIRYEPKESEKTPETLYIMADEKYIALQGKDKPNNKSMEKMIVTFEGRQFKQRYRLVNKRYFYYQDGDIWERLHEDLDKIYNLDNIKNIYILGDGANWIKKGVLEFKGSKFGLDKFHLAQSIEHITSDNKIKELIMDYAIHRRKKDLNHLFESIINNNPNRKETIKQKADYIMNNLEGINTMYKEIKTGCSMEQAIQHVLQSPFTSVPKAYSYKNLKTYINTRINLMNNIDLRYLYLKAIDHKNDNIINIDDNELHFDYNIFNVAKKYPEYKINLPYVSTLGTAKI